MYQGRFLYRLADAFYRRFDYPKGIWLALRALLVIRRGRVPLLSRANTPWPTGKHRQIGLFRFDINPRSNPLTFSSLKDLRVTLEAVECEYVGVCSSGDTWSLEDLEQLRLIADAEGLACIFTDEAMPWRGSVWRRLSLLSFLNGSTIVPTRLANAFAPIFAEGLASSDLFGEFNHQIKVSALKYLQVPIKSAFINRNFPPARSSKKRVTVVAPWFDVAGSSILTSDIFSSAAFEQFSFTSVAMKQHDPRFNSSCGEMLFKRFSYDSENLGLYKPYDRRFDLLNELIEDWSPQILFNANCSDFYRALRKIKPRFAEIKFVDHLFNTSWHFQDALKFQDDIDLYIVANELVKTALIMGGVSDHKIKVIYHGINLDQFKRSQHRSEIVRPLTLGFIGRLSSEKRPIDFVRAISDCASVQGIIFGTGDLEASIKTVILESELEDRIQVKHAPRSAEMYETIDALVVTSEFEGLPMVVLEAMAMELPVIASRVGGIPVALAKQSGDFIFNAGDLPALRKCIARLCELTERQRVEIGRANRAVVEERFSLQTCALSYQNAFDELLRK